jgi:hypothetical protein
MKNRKLRPITKTASTDCFIFRVFFIEQISSKSGLYDAASPAVPWLSSVTESFALPPIRGCRSVPGYRAYIIGRDGHFIKAIALDCADDDAAREYAKQLIDGHEVELWQRDRKIAQFGRKPD